MISANFLETLNADLAKIRDGISNELPGVDWEPLVLAGKLGALADLHKRFTDQALREFELTPVEAQVIGIVRGCAADTPSALARATHQTAAGMTRTLDRLEARGLVKRRPHPSDRRRVAVNLTKRGKEAAERKLHVEVNALEAVQRGLGKKARGELMSALDELIARLAKRSRAGAERAA